MHIIFQGKMLKLTPSDPTLAPWVIIQARLFSVHGWYSLRLAFKSDTVGGA